MEVESLLRIANQISAMSDRECCLVEDPLDLVASLKSMWIPTSLPGL